MKMKLSRIYSKGMAFGEYRGEFMSHGELFMRLRFQKKGGENGDEIKQLAPRCIHCVLLHNYPQTLSK
jgi:hypothetical protein